MKKDKEKDCTMALIKTAKTKWQKEVAGQLVKIENDISWLKWMNRGIFMLMIATMVSVIVGVLI